MSSIDLHLEFIDEGIRLVNAAEEQGIQLRILGSIAYRLQCPKHVHMFDDMQRVLTDVDFAGLKKQNSDIRKFMIAQGYEADEGVYVASEGARHIYVHPETQLNLDVFADELYFCHRIPFIDRLDLDSPTICKTDLLLEKMQIYEINLKDFKDTLVLLLEHPLGTREEGNKCIDMDYITEIMANDWGFYYTFTTNLRRVPDYIPEFSTIGDDEAKIISDRVEDLLQRIEDAPKSFKWKMRAKIGTRMLWYQEVAEKSEQF